MAVVEVGGDDAGGGGRGEGVDVDDFDGDEVRLGGLGPVVLEPALVLGKSGDRSVEAGSARRCK